MKARQYLISELHRVFQEHNINIKNYVEFSTKTNEQAAKIQRKSLQSINLLYCKPLLYLSVYLGMLSTSEVNFLWTFWELFMLFRFFFFEIFSLHTRLYFLFISQFLWFLLRKYFKFSLIEVHLYLETEIYWGDVLMYLYRSEKVSHVSSLVLHQKWNRGLIYPLCWLAYRTRYSQSAAILFTNSITGATTFHNIFLFFIHFFPQNYRNFFYMRDNLHFENENLYLQWWEIW